jgi:ribosome-associated protein
MRIEIAPGIGIEDSELSERFVRASGPGGQNVNKVSSAVELRFNVAASTLPAEVKERLINIAGTRVTSDGDLLIDSREHRTQAQNREAARARLVAFIKLATVRPKKRRPSRPTKSSKEQRLQSKKQRGEIKKARRSIDD